MTEALQRARVGHQSVLRRHVADHVNLYIAMALFLTAVALYAPLRSPAFDDMDAANFSLALDRYDIVNHMPHPPGYPVYVFAARLWRGFLGLVMPANVSVGVEDVLTTFSVLCASAAVVVLFTLTASLWGRTAGVMAGALLLVHPLFWLEAEKALSGTSSPLLFLGCIGAVLAHLHGSRPRLLVGGGILWGLLAGIRPVDAALLLPFFLLALWRLRYDRVWMLATIGSMAVTVVVWIVPSMFGTHGIGHYLGVLLQKTQRVVSLDAASSPLSSIGQRLQIIAGYFTFGYAWIPLVLGLGGAVAMAIEILGRRLPTYFWAAIALPFVWLVTYAVIGSPYAQWYYLPSTASLCLQAGYVLSVPFQGIRRVSQSPSLPALTYAGLVAIVVFVIAADSRGMASELHRTVAAPVQMARSIAESYPVGRTVILARNETRFLDRYLPQGYRVLPVGDALTISEFARFLEGGSPSPVVLVTGDARPFVPVDSELVQTFRRDPLLHRQFSEVALFQVPEIAVLPYVQEMDADPARLIEIDVGVGIPGAELIKGFSHNESLSDGTTYAWTSGRTGETVAALRFRMVRLPSKDLYLLIRAVSSSPEQVVRMRLNGVEMASLAIGNGWDQGMRVYVFQAPRGAAVTGDNLLELDHALMVRPNDPLGDSRSLGIAVDWIRVVQGSGPDQGYRINSGPDP